MQEHHSFIQAVFAHWGTLVSGVCGFLLSFYEKYKGRAISKVALGLFAVACLFIAFYRAWDDEYQKGLDYQLEASNEKMIAGYRQRMMERLQVTINNLNSTKKTPTQILSVSNATGSAIIQGNQASVTLDNSTKLFQTNNIQVQGDLVLQSKRLIESVIMTAELESDTASNSPSGKSFDAGVGVIAALWTDNKTRIRFQGFDRDIGFEQVAQNKRVLSCILKPENPTEICGKDIDFLKTIHQFGIRFGDLPEVHDWPKSEHRRLQISIIINGIMAGETTANIAENLDINDPKGWSFATSTFFERAADNYKQMLLQGTTPSK